MNQLGKNLVYSFCVVATLLVILGVKRKFDGDHQPTLLSQPSVAPEQTTRAHSKGSPQPRVLQAKPVTQHDQAIVSPTSPQYTESDVVSSPASENRVYPIPMTSAPPTPNPSLDAPELVPVAELSQSPITDSVGDEVAEIDPVIESAAAPSTIPTRPEFVLTGADDSFWSISEQVYGSGVYYRALFRHNESKVLRPDQLRPGIQVNTPPLELLQKQYPSDFPTTQ